MSVDGGGGDRNRRRVPAAPLGLRAAPRQFPHHGRLAARSESVIGAAAAAAAARLVQFKLCRRRPLAGTRGEWDSRCTAPYAAPTVTYGGGGVGDVIGASLRRLQFGDGCADR